MHNATPGVNLDASTIPRLTVVMDRDSEDRCSRREILDLFVQLTSNVHDHNEVTDLDVIWFERTAQSRGGMRSWISSAPR